MYQQLPLAISPDAQLTFEHFYQRTGVELLMVALQQFIADMDEGENFIYLWGDSGTGVTHLLHAVQNTNPSLVMQYLPLKTLMEYSPSVIFDNIDQLDVVCIADVETLAGNVLWEENLFHVFNRLREANKKLLIGSHVSPAAIDMCLLDLKSRLQSGLILRLPPWLDDDR